MSWSQRILRNREPSTLVATGLSWLCSSLALLHAVSCIRIGWDMPLLDGHAFRQTHTALTARMIERGGPIFAYETPVMGAPWSIPLEFPLYQLLVVATRAILQMPLDQAGRLVASSLYLATVWPLHVLLRELDVPPLARRIALACFLVSPLYVHWARAFLMESTVLFFSVSACAVGLAAWRRPRPSPWLIVLAATCGMIASAMKPMTAFGWLLLLGICWFPLLARGGRSARPGQTAGFFVPVFVGPLCVALAWTRFTDGYKGSNLLARDLLVSSAQYEWNFGTSTQKFSFSTWQLLWTRTLDGTLGHAWLFLTCSLLGLLLARRLSTAIAPLVGLFATYATFTNLHVVHDYYQCATGLFAIVSIGVGLGVLELLVRRHLWVVPAIGAVALLQSTRAYDEKYRVAQAVNYWLPALPIGQFIQKHTEPESTLLIYGDDWSSRIPYYADRRAIMNRWDYALDEPRLQATIARTHADGHPIAAVVGCSNARRRGAEVGNAIFGQSLACELVQSCVVCFAERSLSNLR